MFLKEKWWDLCFKVELQSVTTNQNLTPYTHKVNKYERYFK